MKQQQHKKQLPDDEAACAAAKVMHRLQSGVRQSLRSGFGLTRM